MLCQNERPKYTYGTLVLGFLAKDERANKTGPRAFRCIYAGESDTTPGDIIVHPYTITEDGLNWELLPSISLNQYKVCEGIMILAAAPNLTQPSWRTANAPEGTTS